MTTPRGALEQIWTAAGGDASALERVSLTGDDPMLPTDVRIGTAAAAVIAATGLAASELWRLRTGRAQSVAVDVRAAIAAFRSERYLRVNGGPAPDGRSPLFGFYPTADGRFIQIHANMPHHHAGHVRFMGCEETRESMAAAVAKWKAQDLEDALNAAGLPAGMVRPKEEWLAHPHARAVAELPLLEIVRIGDSAPEPFGGGDRPLSGVRVLDLTRVIAGPEGGRTLASHGADVLLVSSPHLPNLPSHVIDFGLGKRSATLDLRRAADADRLRALIARADVFSQSYRPGALARLGFAPEEVARLRPGIVYVTLSAYGHAGPVARAARLRDADPVGERPRPRAGIRRRARTPAASPRAGRGSRHRVPGRARRACRPRAPRPRGRELSRARLARADRALGGLARTGGRPPRGRPERGRRR